METVLHDTLETALLEVKDTDFWRTAHIVPYHEDPHPIYLHTCLVCNTGFVGREVCELFCFMCDPTKNALYK
jgi:hypothetical protein